MSDYLLGDGGPELRIPGEEAAMLWPVVREYARDLERKGSTTRLRRLRPLLVQWQYAAGRWALAQAEGHAFPGEFPNGNPDLEQGSLSEAQWLSTAEAERVTGLSRQWLCQLARRGEVESRRIGRGWAIAAASAAELAERRRAG